MSKYHPNHRFQIDNGWCGPAVLQMFFHKAGIKKEQAEIANYKMPDGSTMYDPSWGTSHKNIDKYLKLHFSVCGTKKNVTLELVAELKAKGYEVMANIMAPDMDESGKVDIGGHYVKIHLCDPVRQEITIFDPSNAQRPDGRRAIYNASYKEFRDEWYDYATPQDEAAGIKTEGWIAWVDPITVITTLQKTQ